MRCRLFLKFSFAFFLIIVLTLTVDGDEVDEDIDLNTEFLRAIEEGEGIEVINGLLEEGADPNYRYAGYGPSLPLRYAASGRRERELIELLLDKGAEPTGSDIYRYMLYGCRLEIIKLLAENGADVNYTLNEMYDMFNLTLEEIEENKFGLETDLLGGSRDPLLTLAVEAGRKELIELLIKYGADVNVESGYTNTATTPLISAVRNKENPEIVRVLIRAGADVNQAVNFGYTPLVAAAENGNLKACQSLLLSGADVNAHEYVQNSALKSAVMAGSLKMVSFLCENGADLDMLYSERKNILHIAAAYCSDPEILEYLMGNGIDPLSVDMHNRTPYHLALINDNSPEVLSKLAEYGGDRIVSGWFSEYIKGKDLNADDMFYYKFTADGENILTIDLDKEIRHIRVWHRYKEDYFLTKLEYKVRENKNLSAYDIYHNITLSENGKILAVRNLQNNKIQLAGQYFTVTADSTFNEAVSIDKVSLTLSGKYENSVSTWTGLFAVFSENGELHFMKMALRINYFYPNLNKNNKEIIVDLNEINDDITGDIDIRLQHSSDGKYLLAKIIEDTKDGREIINSAVLVDTESWEVVNIIKINQDVIGFKGTEIISIEPDPYQGKFYFNIKKNKEYFITSIDIDNLSVNGTLNNYIDFSKETKACLITGYSCTDDGEMLAYNNSDLLEYGISSGKLNLLQKNSIKDDIITASYDKTENKWLILTERGLVSRDIISVEDAAVKSILEESKGLLEAGFYKQHLEKVKEAMKIYVTNEYFRSSYYMNLMKHEVNYKDIGDMFVLHYQLLMKEEKTDLVKKEIILRLVEYGLLAERAGQRGLLKQAEEQLKSLSTESYFKDYQSTIEIASQLLEAVYLVLGNNPAEAYDYLLEEKVFGKINSGVSLIDFTEHIHTMPTLWQSLFTDKKKFSFLTGILESDVAKIKYKKATIKPYPDLNGNIIEGFNGEVQNEALNSNNGNENSSDAENSSSESGSIGTVLD